MKTKGYFPYSSDLASEYSQKKLSFNLFFRIKQVNLNVSSRNLSPVIVILPLAVVVENRGDCVFAQ